MTTKSMMYRHEFTVEGTSPFPTDMLRYDGCYPLRSDDAAGICSDRYQRKVTLVKYSSDPRWVPTRGRWSSFLWVVLS